MALRGVDEVPAQDIGLPESVARERQRIDVRRLDVWEGKLDMRFLTNMYSATDIAKANFDDGSYGENLDRQAKLRENLLILAQMMDYGLHTRAFFDDCEAEGGATVGVVVDTLSAHALPNGLPCILVRYSALNKDDPNFVERVKNFNEMPYKNPLSLNKVDNGTDEVLMMIALLEQNQQLLYPDLVSHIRSSDPFYRDNPEFQVSLVVPLHPDAKTIAKPPKKPLGDCICGEPARSWCSMCKKVSYCGRTCQRKDWKRHKKDCALKERGQYVDIRGSEDVLNSHPHLSSFKGFTSSANDLFSQGQPHAEKRNIFPDVGRGKSFPVKVQLPLGSTREGNGMCFVYDKTRRLTCTITRENAGDVGYETIFDLIQSKGEAGGLKGYLSASVMADGKVLRIVTSGVMAAQRW